MTGLNTTEAFLRVIEDTAKQNKAKSITKIWLAAGKGVLFKGNTSAYMEFILKGTVARDAEIYIKHCSAAGRCRQCGLITVYDKEKACTQCGGVIDSISLDKRFIVDMMEIEI